MLRNAKKKKHFEKQLLKKKDKYSEAKMKMNKKSEK